MPVSEKTIENYTRLARDLRHRYTRDSDLEPEADWTEFNNWMDRLYATVAPATRRAYHAALVHYQNEHHPEYPAQPVPRGLDNRKAIRETFGRRGPGRKSKSIPEQTEKALIEALMKACDSDTGHHSPYNRWAQAFMRAGIAFGLRPSEWRLARFDATEDGEPVLHVVNAKQSQERAFGPTRTLIISERLLDAVDDQALGAAQWLISSSFKMTPEEFQVVLDNTAQQLRRIIKACGAPCRLRSKNSITLYTARHQFAANAKRAGMSLLEIAALMGHASTETASRHYGRRQHGRSGNRLPVRPHPENVYEVEVIMQQKAERAKTSPDSGFRPM